MKINCESAASVEPVVFQAKELNTPIEQVAEQFDVLLQRIERVALALHEIDRRRPRLFERLTTEAIARWPAAARLVLHE